MIAMIRAITRTTCISTAKNKAERIRRKFIEDNIEEICGNYYHWKEPFFGHAFKFCEYQKTERISDDCPAFTFPDNITKAWGEALYAFLDNWMHILNKRYGVNGHKNGDEMIAHWPSDIKASYMKMKEARARLHPLIRGETWEQHCQNMRDLMKDILPKIKD